MFPACKVYSNEFMLWNLYDNHEDRSIITIHPIIRNAKGKYVSDKALCWTICGSATLYDIAVKLKTRMKVESDIMGFVIYQDDEIMFVTNPSLTDFIFE